jgi:hypothetical protein
MPCFYFLGIKRHARHRIVRGEVRLPEVGQYSLWKGGAPRNFDTNSGESVLTTRGMHVIHAGRVMDLTNAPHGSGGQGEESCFWYGWQRALE